MSDSKRIEDKTERYVYAVERLLPSKIRKDVGEELKGLIEDMLRERCGDSGEPDEAMLKAVLDELGSPAELANHYSPDKDKCLIGPPFYTLYKTLLTIVLYASGGGTLLASLIEFVTSAGSVNPSNETVVLAILNCIFSTFMGCMYGFAFVTLLFAFFQKKGLNIKDLTPDYYDQLPAVPKKEERISRAECIVGICFSVIFTLLFLLVPQFISARFRDGGIWRTIPVFNTAVIRSLWYLILIYFCAEMAKHIYYLVAGRYTKKLALVNVVTGGIGLICFGLLMTAPNLMNPAFLENMSVMFAGADQFVFDLFSHLPQFLLVIVIFATVLDFGIVSYKAWKYDH